NPVIREIWQQAAAALRSADRVVILGYSLPPADLTFAGMLTDSLRSSSATLTIVDMRGRDVEERLINLGFPAARIEVFDPGAAQPVPAFASRWRDETSNQLLQRLRGHSTANTDDPMMIVWSKDAYAAVTAVKETGGRITLSTDPV